MNSYLPVIPGEAGHKDLSLCKIFDSMSADCVLPKTRLTQVRNPKIVSITIISRTKANSMQRSINRHPNGGAVRSFVTDHSKAVILV